MKKLLAIITSLAVVLAMMPSVAFAEDSSTTQDGTEGNPWEVSNATELREKILEGGHIEITNDIEVGNWISVNISEPVTINGNGYTLSNMTVTHATWKGDTGKAGSSHSGYHAGLIGFGGAKVIINNLNITGADIVPTKIVEQEEEYTPQNGFSSVAVLVGSNYGGAEFNDVHIKNATVTATTKAGLFVGQGSASNVINKCSAENCTVNSTYSYGLLVGINNADQSITISNDTYIKNSKTDFIPNDDFSGSPFIASDGVEYKEASGKYWLTDPKKGWVDDRSASAGNLLPDGAVTSDGTVTYKSIAKLSNGNEYASLEGAIGAASAGDTITLLEDINIQNYITINNGKNIIIDLNNHNIKSETDFVFQIVNAKVHFTGNGVIEEHKADGYAPITAYGSGEETEDDYTVITIDEGIILKGDYSGIFVARDSSKGYKNYGLKINMKGTIDLTAEGYGTKHNYGIYINGNNETTEGNIATFNLDGAKIIGAKAGIYAAGYAEWNIKNTAIEGINTAMEFRAGKATIEGGTYKSNGTPTEVTPNGNGTTAVGAGIAVAQHTTKLPIELNIKSGTIMGYTGLLLTNPQGSDENDAKKVKVSVEGGNISAINSGTNSIAKDSDAEKMSLLVTGGTFSSNPIAYTADGNDVYKYASGKYTVAATAPANTSSYHYWSQTINDDGVFPEYYAPPAPSAPVTPADPITNDGGNAAAGIAPSTTVDTKPVTTTTGGVKTTTGTVDAATGDKLVEKAVANKSEEVVVDVTTSNANASSAAGAKTEVTLPEATVQALAEQTDASVDIRTDNAVVSLDNEAVKEVAKQAGTTGEVKLVVETVKSDAKEVRIEVKLVTSKGTVTNFGAGNVEVTVPADQFKNKNVVCVYIDDEGNYTKMEGKLNADGTYTFVTNHFSTYAIMEEAEADKVIEQQELKALIDGLKFKASTKYTSKKNVKVTAKVLKGDIEAITDMGYTVKYKFYRSEKKSSKYALKTTKTTDTYTNTAGKKGKKYYYKVRLAVYDGDVLVGQTELKQAEYGVRTWKK